MLLNRGPSWRQWSRPQPVNQVQDLGKQCSRYGDLCELEIDTNGQSPEEAAQRILLKLENLGLIK